MAYNYGARKPDRITKTIRLAVIYAVSIMLVGFLLFQLIPQVFLEPVPGGGGDPAATC